MRDDNVAKNQTAVDGQIAELQRLKVEYAGKAAAAVEAYSNGGPDLECELDREAGALPAEIAAECKAVNTRLWRKVKPVALRLLPVPSGFGPPPKAVEAKVETDEGLPKDRGSPSDLGQEDFATELEQALGGKAKRILARIKAQRAEAEAEPVEAVEAPPIAPAPKAKAEPRFRLDKLATTPELSKAAPMDNARSFARDRLSKGGVHATYYYHGDWWQWNGRFYEIAPLDRITSEVYDYLDSAVVRTENGQQRFKPKPEHAEALIKCLKSHVAIDDRDGPPRWLDGRDKPSAESLLVFQDCLVDVETGEVGELTPQLWTHGGVDFGFDPHARCPRWERFLEEVFPCDPESQMTIEEQLGYGMTNDTRFEKGALWVGLKRSGKSTLAWVQERLAGVGACVSLSFHDWMKTENSREHLVGRKVGIFADVRLKPAKSYGLTGYDPGGIDHQSAQLLLNIMGRDKVSLGRKFKKVWEGRLFLKPIITSNEVPNLQDAGGVLVSRFIMLDFKQSFFGREDITLRDQLESELPGIANRCLAAYRRLCTRGRFIQPASGRGLVQKVEEKVSPYVAFMNECFVDDAESKGVSVGWFFETFQEWCRDNRRQDLIHTTTKSNLIQEVTKIERWSWLKSSKPHGEPRRYVGIKKRSFGG
jgi:putative DNA primase/helicase